jgi:hypothetical protein
MTNLLIVISYAWFSNLNKAVTVYDASAQLGLCSDYRTPSHALEAAEHLEHHVSATRNGSFPWAGVLARMLQLE